MPLYLTLLQHALGTLLAVLAPIVLLLLAVGFATSFIQAALQIEDATFALLPKTITMIFIALAGGFGLVERFGALAQNFILGAPALIRQPWW